MYILVKIRHELSQPVHFKFISVFCIENVLSTSILTLDFYIF